MDHTKLALDSAQTGNLLSTVSPDAQALVQATAQVNTLYSQYQNLQAKWDAGDPGDTLKIYLQLAQSAYQTALDTQTQLQLRLQSDQANRGQSMKDAQKAYDDAVRNLADAQQGPDADAGGQAGARARPGGVGVGAGSGAAGRGAGGGGAGQAALAPAPLEAVQAQVDTAQAAADLLDAQLGKLVIVAPADGVILSRSIELGEVASPGATLLVMRRLTDGRKDTVFAVYLAIANPDLALKPGMPADVSFVQ